MSTFILLIKCLHKSRFMPIRSQDKWFIISSISSSIYLCTMNSIILFNRSLVIEFISHVFNLLVQLNDLSQVTELISLQIIIFRSFIILGNNIFTFSFFLIYLMQSPIFL